ncbi:MULTISPECIES: Tab2 family RNA-binding protein [Leptolyngbya]|uniref:Tab2 family RNA-binding protein n=1 Tax=Leptolyngbya TaxID=47251 RepID=UPI00168850E7|nr:Tab2 family RNA-binding protein [Leptolyngbya sp. FACHB-1624]MBD1856316.1 DUF1092 family protein [Leptolyngbya sp. FACHB-1624]
MRNPPQPLPDNFWGEQWRFASLRSSDLVETISNRTIPIVDMPEALHPLNLGVASTAQIPGVVIDGGRRSMQLARWIQANDPRSMNAIAGTPDGLILYAGELDRWILATFDDPEMRTAAQLFEQRKKESKQLHFLLVEPDDSGMTYTGFWLLRSQGV